MSLLPPTAIVEALYDVGCVLDRSLQLVSSFSYRMFNVLLIRSHLTVHHSPRIGHSEAQVSNQRHARVRPPVVMPTPL